MPMKLYRKFLVFYLKHVWGGHRTSDQVNALTTGLYRRVEKQFGMNDEATVSKQLGTGK